MTSLEKWQLKDNLILEEAVEVIQELFEGSNKQYLIQRNGVWSGALYLMYEKFKNTESEIILYFSTETTELRPCISNILFGQYSHVMKIENEMFYIYD